MSNSVKMSITLPPEMTQYIRGLVATGKYSSVSEVIRVGLRWSFEQEEAKKSTRKLTKKRKTKAK